MPQVDWSCACESQYCSSFQLTVSLLGLPVLKCSTFSRMNSF